MKAVEEKKTLENFIFAPAPLLFENFQIGQNWRILYVNNFP